MVVVSGMMLTGMYANWQFQHAKHGEHDDHDD
jgi:hypothetical protein